MVNLTRIYTRAGDDGATRLGDNSVTRKTDPRLAAFADVDEANSALGVALALARVAAVPDDITPAPGNGTTAPSSGTAMGIASRGGLDPEVTTLLEQIQNDLFDVGADLSTPVRPDPPYPPLRVTEAYVEALEEACDRYNAHLEPLRSFILPGGTPVAAQLHVARTVVRRAERTAWAAVDAHGDGARTLGGINLLAVRYLNRLSDLLFILARTANRPTPADSGAATIDPQTPGPDPHKAGPDPQTPGPDPHKAGPDPQTPGPHRPKPGLGPHKAGHGPSGDVLWRPGARTTTKPS